MHTNRLREAWIFLAVTLALSLVVFWGPLALLQVRTISFVGDARGPLWAILLFIVGGFTPSIVALVMTALLEGGPGVRRLLRSVVRVRLGWRSYLGAVLVVIAGASGQIAIALLAGGSYDPTPIVAQLGTAVPLIVLGPLSEELGWRGFAQGRLQTRFGAVTSSLIIGVVWGLWHLPLFFIVGSSQSVLGLPFTSFLVGTTAISVVFGWLYNKTGGSVWSAVFLHWIYTYAIQVVSSGVERSPLYNWLEYLPYLVIAAVIATWLGREEKADLL